MDVSEDIGLRLRQLQSEYEAGQKMLADLEARRSALVTTLLRIEGAIQVLKEVMAPAAGDAHVQQSPEAAARAHAHPSSSLVAAGARAATATPHDVPPVVGVGGSGPGADGSRPV
jgi:hypothetical protein